MKSLLAVLLVSASTGSLLPCPGFSADGRRAIARKCGRCHSFDDPHISTFDGVAYDHHNDGCFKYVTECRNVRKNPVPFEICGCHGECEERGGAARCIGDLTLSFFDAAGKTFNIEIDQLVPLVADDTISAGTLVHASSHTFDLAEGHSFTYLYNAATTEHIFKISGGGPFFYAYISYRIGYLEVFLDADYFQQKNTCGLCGFFDSKDFNDFKGSDNVLYLPPPLIPIPYPITPSIVNSINDFADTYLCEDDDETECYEIARVCCGRYWKKIAAIWKNKIVPAKEFAEDWMLGCIADACAITDNALTAKCEAGHGFSFATRVGHDTATRTYQ
jgi:hypothetical protein